MAFVAICKALYDYAPQGDGELLIREGELLYILEKSSDDDWWKAKKKAENEDEEEPEGLVPNNYVEEAHPTHQARALFDYSRQTDEELSFAEDDLLHVYDTSDEDWTLVGLNGEFGFVPANYIDADSAEAEGAAEEEEEEVASPPLPVRPPAQPPTEEVESPVQTAPNPAANIASILGGGAARTPIAPPRAVEPAAEEESEDEAPPPMPQRPVSEQISPPPQEDSPTPPDRSGVVESPPANRVSQSVSQRTGREAPGGYHLYNINEMVAVMGKMKKMPTTLGINLGLGVIIVMPERKRDGPQQEWTAEKLSHYSIEGKHVFVDLVKPSKSFDFHAGAKDTAEEIVGMLGELAGAVRAEGLREVIAAGSGGQKKGQMLYDFMAQGDDEVTVADGDEVIILDDTLSEEWWKVRRVTNGKEGVVPSSYVEVTGLVSPPPPQPDPSTAAIHSGLSTVERNRRDEERLTREALANSKSQPEPEARPSRRSTRTDTRSSKSKPDQAKLRTWTDRSASFKVEAQFIGLKDGKIHLHKVNGVKIAVPVAKMSKTDIEYVERTTGRSLDDEKPLADRKAVNGTRQASGQQSSQQSSKPEYDWFDFFLRCGVSPYQCERYSYNFNKDSMDEGVLSDINPTVLRNLGLKEGDILRVMKYLDNQFGRTGDKVGKRNVSFGGDEVLGENGESGGGSLFSGPGGALKNNRAKGRPAPAVATNDEISAHGLEKGARDTTPTAEGRSASPDERPPPPPKDNVGFEDNAWDVKPTKQSSRAPAQAKASRTQTATPPAKATSPPPPPALTGGMADLSLLTQPLQPTKLSPPPTSQQSSSSVQQSSPATQPTQQPQQQQQSNQTNQQQGANPSFFSQLNPQQTGLPQTQQQNMIAQPTGQFQFNPPRQRPQAPAQSQQGPLMPPPPARPMSAPQNPGQNSFGGGIGYANSSSPPPNLNQMQQMQQLQPQYTSFNPQNQGFNQQQPQFSPNHMQPQMTGFQPQQQQQFGMNGQMGSTFGSSSLQPQQTGYQPPHMNFQSPPGSGQGMAPQPTGSINSMLPPALQPQSTGAVNGFGRPAFGQPPPPMPSIPSQYQSQQQQSSLPPPPPIPQQTTAAPLQPQKTGPAPNVKFGVQPDAKKLMAQPTGRKANLAHATPDNPFGF